MSVWCRYHGQYDVSIMVSIMSVWRQYHVSMMSVSWWVSCQYDVSITVNIMVSIMPVSWSVVSYYQFFGQYQCHGQYYGQYYTNHIRVPIGYEFFKVCDAMWLQIGCISVIGAVFACTCISSKTQQSSNLLKVEQINIASVIKCNATRCYMLFIILLMTCNEIIW